MEKIKEKSFEVFQLQKSVKEVLSRGNNVFISGCGATGRLALSIEKIYRQMKGGEQVKGFMAAGDYALIRSVESFEDNASYGEKQLMEMGFSNKDLLIAVTEGGETSFVIGTAQKASEVSLIAPYFLYCNPDEELLKIKRSFKVLENDKIKKLNLSVGAMALSGSTRMQATSVQMLAVGFGVLYDHSNFEEFEKEFLSFIDALIESDLRFLEEFIKEESDIYKKNELITYRVDSHLGIAILTDTTERAPTFSLYSFENSPREHLSLSYLCIKGRRSSKEAWRDLLGRTPRCLDWKDVKRDISESEIYLFDISENAISRRSQVKKNHIFSIYEENGELSLELNNFKKNIKLKTRDLLFTHMFLKLLMNTHSTLVMGLMDRFEGNMMTYVKASNYKLVDRALRYIVELLRAEDIHACEEEILSEIFKNLERSDKPIVSQVRDILKELKTSSLK